MATATQQQRALKFAEEWLSREGDEKSETQAFWLDLLRDVYGRNDASQLIRFEKRVKDESTGKHKGFIDAKIDSTRVLIEQKKASVDLTKKELQSDGAMLTPYEQALRYDHDADADNHALFIITCNFREFRIHDMRRKTAAERLTPEIIRLENFQDEYHRLSFLTDTTAAQAIHEQQLSIQAGALVGKLYNALLNGYPEEIRQDAKVLKSLNILCVRLVFCCYAEDALLFGTKGSEFHDVIEKFRELGDVSNALERLFSVLDTPENERKLNNKVLNIFPYVSGGLFSDTDIIMPDISEETASLLLDEMSAGFNWSSISPTIFGAIFESTLNPETRRKGGMHYTSVENIHKVIDPLFLTGLRNELEAIKQITVKKTQINRLLAYQEKLASLRFLDPACGSGNFLTETYLSLRKLENEVILTLNKGQGIFGFDDQNSPIKVDINQFFGIEINDFAVSVAKTALWIAESQMFHATQAIVNEHMEFFPLKSNSNIVEGNALTLDWNAVASTGTLSYIMGNPPFIGARLMAETQKAELQELFGTRWKNTGNLDYVSCWFKKAVDTIQNTEIRCAFVATNSLCQGESVAILWKPLFEMGCHIDFAWRTFIWDSEANEKAHVHCVIIGFSVAETNGRKIIFMENGKAVDANTINGYLVDGEPIFIESRTKPICDVPAIGIGNKPIDDGNYLFTDEEKTAFLQKEPKAQKFFRNWYGSVEFIKKRPRHCLWLGEADPIDLLELPECQKRIQAVREFRLNSRSAGTRKIAERPRNFHVENIPSANYLLIPSVSSENRRYVPIGFMEPTNLASNLVLIVPNATLFHFGVLTSSVHMAWIKNIAGRLKSDFRYSKDIVYNNFPWPEPTEQQQLRIEKTARAILDERDSYPTVSYADLYGEKLDTLFDELRKVHQENDHAVMDAYGFSHEMTEQETVAELMKLYSQKTQQH